MDGSICHQFTGDQKHLFGHLLHSQVQQPTEDYLAGQPGRLGGGAKDKCSVWHNTSIPIIVLSLNPIWSFFCGLFVWRL